MLRSKVTLLFMTLGLLIAVPAVALAQDASDPTGTPSPAPLGPTIQSDKEDYPPADTVILTGSGWQPGETVNINVNDDEGQTWNRNVDVIADENGGVRDEFVLPDWFVATYSVTATGSSGTIATSTFTDAVLPARGCPAGSPIVVDTTDDQFDDTSATNECSLREAINAANGDLITSDTITLRAGSYTLTRTRLDGTGASGEDNNEFGDLDIRGGPLTINGDGATTTNIQAGTDNTNGIDRVLHVMSSGSLTLNRATVRHGQINDDGGGIKSDRPLTLTDVAITDNQAGNGGGISHQGSQLVFSGVTISGNTASLDGGGLYSFGTTSGSGSLTNVTITNNSATGNGGGLRAAGANPILALPNLNLTQATVSHNSAPNGSNISRSTGPISLRNTIVSDPNPNNDPNDPDDDGENCAGVVQNFRNNLDSGTSCDFESNNGSKSGANADLGDLANNGGPTDTRALLSGSAAIDAGNGFVGSPSTSGTSHGRRTAMVMAPRCTTSAPTSCKPRPTPRRLPTTTLRQPMRT